MPQPATDLATALNLFNPLHPLQTEEELRDLFVDRPHSPLKPLCSYLRIQQGPVKVLFMGHRGSGKSTELAKLGEQLRDAFTVVPFLAGKRLNINDVEPVDVVLGCGLALLDTVLHTQAKTPDSLWGELEEWLRNVVLEESVTVRPSGMPAEFGASLKFLVGEISAKWKAESSTRRTLRPRLQSMASELVERINEVIVRARELEQRSPLLLVEDLDKSLLPQARRIFFEEGQLLRLLDCPIVYTFPIALRYSNDYAQIRHNFEIDFKLPNIKIQHRDGTPDADGRAALRRIIERRSDPSLFEQNAVERIIDLCGGLVVDLIRLAQQAVLRAIVDDAARVTRAMVDEAAAEIRSDYRAALRAAHYQTLRECAVQHDCVNEETVQEVLHNLSLLEYRNSEDWCDVHPIVKPLLTQQGS